MGNYRKINLVAGWLTFLVAAIVYLMTIEPTASFWDCGEFIATAFKLEVGHPPGAPLFMILGRFFTLFAGGDLSKVAITMNVLSALASAFTILFLFWSITHLVKKLVVKNEEITSSNIVVIIGSGLVGALAYTFSDTFWFSAVEAEVYATSSLFTAVVFWAMLKWENVADEKYANRWIILIAYLMGLSIGIHLLNLLAIPALVMIYYFRKYTPTVKGVVASLLISVILLAFLLYIIIPGVPFWSARFELLFVNGLGLPYNTGVLFGYALLAGFLIWAIYFTHKKRKILWNTVITGVFVLVMGYSSYAVIVIRSIANTPLDESNPETIFELKSYLNREQYGDRPLVYGTYFNARPVGIDKGKPKYYAIDGRYVKTQTETVYEYSSEFKGFFPRMWSSQGKHANEYIYWGKLDESKLYDYKRDSKGNPVAGPMGQVSFDRSQPKEKPSFGQNLKFFFDYQVGYMYLRYFMWNFAGRQNDIQGSGELTKGNWISGIGFIDDARLGPQKDLPQVYLNNKGHNRYYLLPLLLGLAGLFFQYKRNKKDFWLVTLLFVLTGLAIVVYLNQYPLQPRERDYAYAGSFYAYAIWIGIGVAALSDWISRKNKTVLIPATVTLSTLILVPGIMASENWDDHSRAHRYTAKTFAYNFLNSCKPNAVIFTNGDNDTFPLWYIQEVENFRTDVRVVNLSYLTADWYIEQMKQKMYDSDPLPISMTKDQFIQGKRDYAVLVETAVALIRQKYEANKAKYENRVSGLYDEVMKVLDRSQLPASYPKDYAALADLKKNMDPLKLYSYLRTFMNPEVAKKIGIDDVRISSLASDLEVLIRQIDTDYVSLKDAMDFLASDDPRFKDGQYFIPARKFIIPVDTSKLADWVVPAYLKDDAVEAVRFQISDEVVYKNLITVLDILANNNWERPIYYSTTVSGDNFLNLDDYFVREGMAYRIAPVYTNPQSTSGGVNTDQMYEQFMNDFQWGGIDDPRVYLDENNLRMTLNFRYGFAILAGSLAEKGETDKAIAVLDEAMRRMPRELVPYNAAILTIIQAYFSAGGVEQAMKLVNDYEDQVTRELDFYRQLSLTGKERFVKSEPDFLQAVRDLNAMRGITTAYGELETAMRLENKVEQYAQDYEKFFRY